MQRLKTLLEQGVGRKAVIGKHLDVGENQLCQLDKISYYDGIGTRNLRVNSLLRV